MPIAYHLTLGVKIHSIQTCYKIFQLDNEGLQNFHGWYMDLITPVRSMIVIKSI